MRTRAVEDVATTPCILPQTVLLAAGLDTLAWRPSINQQEQPLQDIYEIDLSQMFLDKFEKLASIPKTNTGKHVYIQSDLTGDNWKDKLLSNGFQMSLPTVWIMEGLLYYLTLDQTRKFFQIIDSLSCKSSRFFFDHLKTPLTNEMLLAVKRKLLNSYMDNPKENELAWLADKYDWNIETFLDFNHSGEHYGRKYEAYIADGKQGGIHFVRGIKT
ncbi:unnamed protein product [Didymodactylos carnosus]|uniref:S-adenosyl-L-methionine-dependent methyltransferase n=1 Tax=Didymodactylos carnosus TaxID=1234261 RepID=A0A815Y6X4_9BILA|nr:unnamed protein product [Didymodactylos carnosus]CAF1567604.1 unnamed protein product [Didymodactylos carnosus]CAF4040923.1 unnamed protein product [Didymodactylos carnosus]CAF4430050.1 unnamed protein product [Didymodactylos carnosus]